MLPYVRRREHSASLRRFNAAIEGLAYSAPLASQAQLHALKPLSSTLSNEVCFFVSHATQPQLKHHVEVHLDHLLRAGLKVVLILNSELAPEHVVLEEQLLARLSGVYLRENVGFDFAAWAQVFALCQDTQNWTRLFLINDSIVGPLNTKHFDQLMARARGSDADVLGLTEVQAPQHHLQSYFLVLNASALRNPVTQRVFSRMLSLPCKSQVIDVYETRLTGTLKQHGLSCMALFPPLSNDRHSSDDTILRWDKLIESGFPYIKTSILDRYAGTAQLRGAVPAEFIPQPGVRLFQRG
ncbi:rhamnan synthesis F family protein [Paucibacter sp. TC2R-5]|uniref:rhamnan synthesis F family protein n=1 Tax=Paucibacter sp. TC2R-5 TaxID=2893555 RepID=UPI0021E373CD|nr:rhamnan synthesis F family protein [Paucibacter sp. TC2R-5]